ncbi:MAG: metalloregulator ArsR/SmtB family transcription factor, partial [Pseudomonadota bacterium]
EANLDAMADNAKTATDFLKALAHESRLMILCYLSSGEKSVKELEDLLAARQPSVSQQLARLRLEGFIEARREGRVIYYRIADPRVATMVEQLYTLFCAPECGDQSSR